MTRAQSIPITPFNLDPTIHTSDLTALGFLNMPKNACRYYRCELFSKRRYFEYNRGDSTWKEVTLSYQWDRIERTNQMEPPFHEFYAWIMRIASIIKS